MVLPDTARAYTSAPPIPEPNADQLFPSHLAMPLAAVPPASKNAPPTYRSLPETARTVTPISTPEPSADQVAPSHLAMLVTAMPPAVLNKPPAYRSLPDTARAKTSGLVPFNPSPNADQLL